MKNEYHLYIEPYTHIEFQNNKLLFYNTIDGKSLRTDKIEIINLFKDIKKNKDLCFVEISKNKLDQEIIYKFIQKLRDLFMCDYLDQEALTKKPVIFKNESTVSDPLSKITPPHFSLKNISDLNIYLKEITIITNNLDIEHNLNKTYFQTSSKQEIFDVTKQLSNENIDLIKNVIKFHPIEYVNIVGTNVLDYSNINKLFEYLNKIDVVKVINIYYNDLVKLIKNKQENTWLNFFNELNKEFSIINVFIDFPINNNDFNLIRNFSVNFDLNTEIQFLIEKEEDVKIAESLIEGFPDMNFVMLPFYNLKNLDFFKKNVFLTEYEIMDIPPLDSKDILIKSTLNPNYFGKLIFMSNGDIYSNIHSSKVGNLKDNNLHKIIYKELNDGNWVFTRKKTNPCKTCIYNVFCPPINKYEFDLKKINLCHFM